jgi:F-type H+-transporting ATPase subunit b
VELSWSTFVLEIINFLVLVWILKHFLYRPVLDVIARRRAGIEQRLADARQLHDDAEALKADYENRVADSERERQQARAALARELDEERARQLQALQATLAQEREKAQVMESSRRAEAAREIEQRALQQSAQFAARLLAATAGPELEARLLDVLLEGLTSLPGERVAALRTQWGEPPDAIVVASAYPLADERRQQLETALTGIIGHAIPVRYERDEELVAGLQISIGAWLLHANVRDELRGFAEFAHAAR